MKKNCDDCGIEADSEDSGLFETSEGEKLFLCSDCRTIREIDEDEEEEDETEDYDEDE